MRFINEAIACYREKIVDNKDLLDAGIIFGTGFAPFRGGPIRYVETTGAASLLDTLNALHEQLGDRFRPDAGWQEFYTGQTSDMILKCMKRTDGLITKEDLQNYKRTHRMGHPAYGGWMPIPSCKYQSKQLNRQTFLLILYDIFHIIHRMT